MVAPTTIEPTTESTLTEDLPGEWDHRRTENIDDDDRTTRRNREPSTDSSLTVSQVESSDDSVEKIELDTDCKSLSVAHSEAQTNDSYETKITVECIPVS